MFEGTVIEFSDYCDEQGIDFKEAFLKLHAAEQLLRLVDEVAGVRA